MALVKQEWWWTCLHKKVDAKATHDQPSHVYQGPIGWDSFAG